MYEKIKSPVFTSLFHKLKSTQPLSHTFESTPSIQIADLDQMEIRLFCNTTNLLTPPGTLCLNEAKNGF